VRAAFLLALAALSGGLWADSSSATSVPSFKLMRGARPAAMAGAYTAVAQDTDSLYWNPAGLNGLREVQLTANHLEWLDGVRDETLALGVPLYGFGAWGLGMTYLYATDEGRDNFGNRTGSFSNFDFSAMASFALMLGDDGSVGANYKIIRQGYGPEQGYDSLDGYPSGYGYGSGQGLPGRTFSMGSGFDLGFQYKGFFDRKLVLGFTAMNMGTNVALGSAALPLPLTLRLGTEIKPVQNLNLSTDYEYQPYDYFASWKFGGEYAFPWADERKAFVRLGYLIGPENTEGSLAGLSAGLGLQWGAWTVDYAFLPKGDLGISHMFSISLGFGSH
jgi:hypothetical protein